MCNIDKALDKLMRIKKRMGVQIVTTSDQMEAELDERMRARSNEDIDLVSDRIVELLSNGGIDELVGMCAIAGYGSSSLRLGNRVDELYEGDNRKE